ncbi:hypothetical protein CDL12_27093 [Handroanthus impetiginosus]|uniref:Auxin efflux carrier component n=1 Tax=Handroanthus impetiginosus TaxID=429701 RepID=A0A2G9G522_9LAMI|nr:hypothetical protein CDL12_27093 [Handroanthus impetiginosus]
MIGWEDVYKVVVAMVPLYVALGLGYGSVKWWRMFKPDHCDVINRFNAYFIIPFFTFQFICNVDPYHMNYRFLAGDVFAKVIAGVALALWVNLWKEANLSWAITAFSIATLNNTLVVGVPLLRAMYGPLGENLVVQSFVIQSLLWFPLLLFMLEFWRTLDYNSDKSCGPSQLCSIEIVVATNDANNISTTTEHDELQEDPTNARMSEISTILPQYSFGSTMKKVCVKLAKNPNIYACSLGLIWALLAKRWNFEIPSIVDGSIQIMAKAGSGVAMFSIGLFMALQEKVIACGMRLTIYSMALRFVGGPLTMAIGALALGLRSNVLCIVLIQAALPQAITSFIFAQEYGLHANLLSTAVIFGTIISLPLLIAYYAILEVIQ